MLRFFVILIMSCFIFFGCEKESKQPTPQPELNLENVEFVWHVQDSPLLSKRDQYDELMRTLKYVDRQITYIDNNWRLLHAERAKYLEIRVHLLYQIYNVSDFIEFEVNTWHDVETEGSEKRN